MQGALVYNSGVQAHEPYSCVSQNRSEILMESLDGGLHLSNAGHSRFADALDEKVAELHLTLPMP